MRSQRQKLVEVGLGVGLADPVDLAPGAVGEAARRVRPVGEDRVAETGAEVVDALQGRTRASLLELRLARRSRRLP